LRRLLLLLAAFALLVAACGSDDTDDTAASGSDADSENTTETNDSDSDSDSGGDAAGGDMGDPATINFSFGFPEGHPVYQEVFLPWADEVNAATDGTVTIEFFPGGALGPPPTEYERIVSGGTDVGWSLTAYTPGRFPASEVVEIPYSFESAVQGTEALWTLYEEFPEFQAEYDDTKVLGLMVHDVGALWSSTDPMLGIDDVQGKSFRSAGPSVNRLITALGATPVNMPVTELFDAMDKGTVDGTVIAASALTDFNLTPLISSGILCDCYVLNFFVNMNLAKWDSLSPAQQAAIEELSGREFSVRAAEVFDRGYQLALEDAEAAGVQLVELEGEEAARWDEAGDIATQQWIEDATEAGIPAQAMYDRLLEITG
jgi:TRAP-type C4-dicarboxylate transport system substrate-binding protein